MVSCLFFVYNQLVYFAFRKEYTFIYMYIMKYATNSHIQMMRKSNMTRFVVKKKPGQVFVFVQLFFG